MLEGQGLIRIVKKTKDTKLFELIVNPDEVEQGVSGSPLLVEILEEGMKALDKIKN